MADSLKKRATYGDIAPSLSTSLLRQMMDRLHRQEPAVPVQHIDIHTLHRDVDNHLMDAVLYGHGATQTSIEPAIQKHSDAEMVMEMIRRGFAVAKSKPERLT